MNGELMPYAMGEVKVPAADRKVAKEAKKIYDQTRLDGYRLDGMIALAKHAMDGVKSLDEHRNKIAGDDPVLNMALVEIEVSAVKGAGNVIKKATGNGGWNL